MNYLDLPKELKKEYIQALYDCFVSPRDFELFLNHFLQKIGFDEVVTTQYVGDKGIDLTCIKKGIDVGGIDTINYYIQAKRYKLSNKVQAKEIRDLKGSTKRDKNGNVLNCNFINVLITTSDFTKGAIEEAISNPNNPTILINGEKLLDMCIENGIGFTYKPVLVKEAIKSLFAEVSTCDTTPVITIENDYIVSREITANDIRARILIIPQLIKNIIGSSDETISVVFNGTSYQLNIDKTRRYLGGVTDIYKQSGLINEDNIFISKQAKWKLVDNVIHITIE
mgnify:CR=1 FL=1